MERHVVRPRERENWARVKGVLRDLPDAAVEVQQAREELVEGRVQQANGHGQPIHRAEDGGEVLSL